MSVQMSVENYKVIKNRAGRERSGNRRKVRIGLEQGSEWR